MEEGRLIDRIVIKASPFIRTMATAVRISTELEVNSVDLDWMFCEWIADCLYTTNPMQSLEVLHKDAAALNNEFDL